MAKNITFKLGSSLQTEKGTNMQNFTNPTRLKETALMWGIFVAEKSLIKGFCKYLVQNNSFNFFHEEQKG